MDEIHLPPRASSLSESMRDIGYSLETAVADIIDNSITAGATRVDIWCSLNTEQPVIAITDNGQGMSREVLIEAMRHGSTHPGIKRESDDLGRFGLGLKTASFSQCRRLVVISSQNNNLTGATWDLDKVLEDDDWILGVLNHDEIMCSPYIDRIELGGTLVLWQKLDRFCESEQTVNIQNVLYEKIEVVERHLSLVFHRFLSGEVKGKKLEIFINKHKIEPFDPFCLNNKATQLLQEEIVRLDGHEIKIQPYILPHHSKLSPKEHDYYQSRSEFVSNQGVYVYRNYRLMAWGNWFRLEHKSEATKLARVKIDFPNDLDEYWTIDIKKSRAQPPYQVRERLHRIINKIVDQSIQVHSGRSRKLFDEVKEPLWLKYAEHGGIKFTLNRDHPLLSSFEELIEKDLSRPFQEVLTVIEDSIPVEAIYSDYSISPKSFDESEKLETEEIIARLHTICEILLAGKQYDADILTETLSSMKSFRNYLQEIKLVIQEIFYE